MYQKGFSWVLPVIIAVVIVVVFILINKTDEGSTLNDTNGSSDDSNFQDGSYLREDNDSNDSEVGGIGN